MDPNPNMQASPLKPARGGSAVRDVLLFLVASSLSALGENESVHMLRFALPVWFLFAAYRVNIVIPNALTVSARVIRGGLTSVMLWGALWGLSLAIHFSNATFIALLCIAPCVAAVREATSI